MKTMLIAAATLFVAASTGHAQRPGALAPPATWASVYGLMYTSISGLVDPGSESRWLFDDNALGLGASLHRQLNPSLLLGIDASLARPKYERQSLDDSSVIETGNANVATAMMNGRFAYGGASEVGLYLTGGIGTVAYRLEDLASWNADFALQAGTGIEYRFQRNKSAALEWGRTWGYHEKEGLGGGSQQHSVLKLVLRLGL